MAGRGAEESREAESRFQVSSYAYVPCIALIYQRMEAQKVTACKPYLGLTLLKPEKRLALCAQLTYYNQPSCLTEMRTTSEYTLATLLTCAVWMCSHCAGTRRPSRRRRLFVPYSRER